MTEENQTPQKLMILIALLQGLGLLYLHQAIELDFWPNNQPQWLFSFYSIVLALPVMLLLGLTHNNWARLVSFAVPFSVLVGVLGYYVGLQAIPVQYIRYGTLLFGFALTISLATFKALMYMQQLAARETISYTRLFRWSWRNFLTLTLSLLFAGSFWLILLLWGALFEAIDIHFFDDLFKEPWFYYPTVALANGFGVIIFRRLTHVIDTITRLQQALMKFLLILLVLVSVLFLAALPFTGLDSLWKNGGSALILWMQALMLFFVSAVYQDDPNERPYPLALHRFIYIGVALLPVYSAIAFYGLSLRVDQYGWSIARCWAFLIWFLLAMFPLGYWWGIAKERDNWTAQLSRVNVAVGLVVLAGMLLVNSPLLDFRKIVVNSQLERLESGEIEPDSLELRYFRYQLAKPGYEALQELKQRSATSHPALAMRINQLYRDGNPEAASISKEELLAAITLLGEDPPGALLDEIYANETESPWRLANVKKFYLNGIDLSGDSQTDYLLMAVQDRRIELTLYYFEDGEWKAEALNLGPVSYSTGADRAAFIESFTSAKLEVIRPKWNHVYIGGQLVQVNETYGGSAPSILRNPNSKE